MTKEDNDHKANIQRLRDEHAEWKNKLEDAMRAHAAERREVGVLTAESKRLRDECDTLSNDILDQKQKMIKAKENARESQTQLDQQLANQKREKDAALSELGDINHKLIEVLALLMNGHYCLFGSNLLKCEMRNRQRKHVY
jgi:chromosome segregation ATPase